MRMIAKIAAIIGSILLIIDAAVLKVASEMVETKTFAGAIIAVSFFAYYILIAFAAAFLYAVGSPSKAQSVVTSAISAAHVIMIYNVLSLEHVSTDVLSVLVLIIPHVIVFGKSIYVIKKG